MSPPLASFVWLRRVSSALTVLILCGIGAFLVHEENETRARHETELAVRSENLARVYAEVVRSYVRELDTALILLRDAVSRGDEAGFARAAALLRRGPLAELTIQIAVVGPDGRLRYSSLGTPATPVDLSDRAHFRAHLGQAPDRLYIGAPVLGRVSGQWLVPLSRRIVDAQGRFAGVLVLAVPPAALTRLGAEVDLGPDHALTLIKPDLSIVSRYPHGERYFGLKLPESARPFISPPYRAHLRPSTLDGRARMIAYKPLPEYELLAGVSLSLAPSYAAMAAEMRHWRYLAAFLAALTLGLWWLSRRSLRQREAAARLREAAQQRLERTLSLAGFGSWEYDVRQNRFVWSPSAYAVFGYPEGELPPAPDALLARVPAAEREQVRAAVRRCKEDGLPFEVECRLLAEDGLREKILFVRGYRELDADGQPCCLRGIVLDVTESRHLASALQEAEKRWQWAVNASRDGIWDIDVRHERVWYSPRCKTMLGYAPEEIEESAAAWTALVHPDDRAGREQAWRACLERQTPFYEAEFRVRAKDGGWRWILARGQVVEADAEGAPVRLLGTHSDISARKEIELALAQERGRLAEAQAVAQLGSWEWDVASGELWWSAETFRLFGLAPGEIAPTLEAFMARVHPDDRARVQSAVNASLRQDVPYQVEHRLVRPDGTLRVVQERGRVERDADGNPVRMVGTVHDITREQEAQLGSQLAEAVFVSTLQPIVVTDVEGKVVKANPAFCQLAGYELDEIVGRSVGSIMQSGQQGPAFYAQLWQCLGQEGHWEGEVWNRRRSGEVVPQWLAITAIRNPAGETERYVGIYMDITEHKRREEHMWRAANYDHLTGLPNRMLLQDRLKAALARARRQGTRLGVLFIDLDHFKAVNDTYGHRAGDTLLQEVARRMAACVRADDTLARIAGDEFVALLQNLSSPEQAEQIAAKLRDAATLPVDLDGQWVSVSCSIGYTLFPDDDPEGERLIDRADRAMYRVKQGGRNGIARCDEEQASCA